MNRYPPPPRPYDMPPHPMSMGHPGSMPPNSNYNQYKYESEEHAAMRRGNPHNNNNWRGGPPQNDSNGRNKPFGEHLPTPIDA